MEQLSLVICAYNESQNIVTLIDWIDKSLKDYNYEIVIVDDGSTDKTAETIKALDRKNVKLIELKKNYGQSTALAAGIDEAEGNYIVTLDADLQNDPADIPNMLKKLKDEQLDLVAGIRTNRKDGFLLRKIPSKIVNFIIRLTTNVKMKDYGCTLKVFTQETAKGIKLYGELHRFIPVLAYLDGANIGQMKVRHHSRKYGKSNYGLSRTFKVLSDLILMVFFKKYLQKPMHLFGGGGLIIFLAGVIINLYLLVLKILDQDIWGKPLLILGVLLLVAGIQLVTIGIVTELLMRIYYESQNKTTYKIKKITSGTK